MPPEDKFNSNAKSPRFSTSKAIGFKGGQQPSFQQASGINPVAPPTSPKPAPTGATVNPAISQFEAPRVSQPSLGGTLATGAASAAAGEVAKQGAKAGSSALLNYFGAGSGAAPGTLETANAVGASGGDSLGSLIGENAGRWGADMWYGAAPGTLDAANAVGDSGGDALGSLISGNAENWGVDVATDLSGSIDWGANAADLAMETGGDLIMETGGDLIMETGGDLIGGAAGDTFLSGVPVLGPLYRASQGDYGGAAGSAIGGAIGSAIFPGIGTAIGSALGGALGGGCFITEAVMSAGGQGDTAPELEALRQFRDQVLSTTPQGQALIQEYESIAPVVVEAVMQRPDSLQIFQSIDAQFINPAVEAVNQGDFQKALQIYAQMISFVTPFAMEGGEGETMPAGMGGDMDAMQQMGEHAAMVGYSPEMAGAATGDMGGAGLDEDPNGYDGGPQGPQGPAPMMQQFAQPRY